MFKLIIQDDEGKTTVVPLIRDEITIGRKEGNTIRLTERNVSRRHARILRSNGSVLIEDLDSYNGIKVNGSRVSGRVKVAESDRIQIGDYLLELKFDRVAQAGAGEDVQSTQPIEKIDQTAVMSGGVLPIGQQPTMQLPMVALGGEPTLVAAGSAAPRPAEDDRPATGTPSRPPRVAGVPSTTAPEGIAVTELSELPLSDEPARLVVISANLAGKEFVLDGEAMVIGRTDENDVVINHRSISRHHAKIVKEHGRYAIVDLQSSNGVRVNGEEYGKVELRRGDLIDLGHVRFRFIEPGEDFVYARDAALIKGAHRGGLMASRSRVLLLLGLAAAGAAAGVYVLKTRKAQEPEVVQLSGDALPAIATQSPPDAARAAMASPDGAPADPTANVLLGLVADAEDAARREDWAAALKGAQAVLAKQPKHAGALALKERATVEQAAQKVFGDFQKASTALDWATMERLLKRLPDGSVYQVQARGIWDEKTRANGEKVLATAERLRTEGKCLDLRALIRREGTRILREQKEALDDAATRCVSKTPVKVPDPGPGPGTDPTPPDGAAQQAAYERALQSGRDAMMAQSYSTALKMFEAALDAKPGDQDAAQMAGVSACYLKNAEVAGKYIRRLKTQTKQSMVRQLCFKNGVTPRE